MAPVTIEPALPGLELLQQPVQFREHLSRVLTIGRQADGERVLDAGFSVRRYVPGKRCVVDIEVTIGDLVKNNGGWLTQFAADGNAPNTSCIPA